MYIEGSNKSVKINYHFDLKSPGTEAVKAGKIPFKNIYASHNMHLLMNKALNELNQPGLINVYAKEGKDLIFTNPKYPTDLGCLTKNGYEITQLKDKIAAFQNKETIKIAVFLSSALGDMIVAFSALRIFYNELLKHFKSVEIDILQEDSKNYMQILTQQEIVNKVIQLPITLDKLCKYDVYVDLDIIHYDEAYKDIQNQPMIDMYLDNLGLDKLSIPDKDKRNKVKINPKVESKLKTTIDKLKRNDKKLLLFHPKSTPIRSIPKHVIPKFLDYIIANTDYIVVSVCKINYINERFVDLSALSIDFEHYAYIISCMDSIITVDTSTYHIADSFDIPTIVLFTSIKPEYRVKYYPHTKGIMLADENNPIIGKNISINKDDIAYVANLFDKLNPESILIPSICHHEEGIARRGDRNDIN